MVVADEEGLCAAGETPICWEDDPELWLSGVPAGSIKAVGSEDAVVDLQGCGVGQGADCCIFALGGLDGLECGRRGELRRTLLLQRNLMTASRAPKAIFPGCYLPEEAA